MLPRRLHAAVAGGDGGGRTSKSSPFPTPLNPLHLLRAKLPLPCPILTSFLSGGLPSSSITELSGESSTGKTQLCLHLSAASTPCLYISTEPPFPLRRLRALSSCSPSSLDQVFVAFALTPDELLARLVEARRFPAPRVIVVDSVAAVFRAEFDNSAADIRKRAGLMFKIAAELKALAWRFECAVVVTNQIVDVISNRGEDRDGIGSNGNASGSLLLSSGREVAPALGLAWANCVNTRLFLSREDVAADVGTMKVRRRMRVVFAPHLPEQSCEFEIRKDGVFGLPPLLDRPLFGKV